MTWNDLGNGGLVLIVDDAMENIHILNAALKGQHDVVFALDGEKALEIARTQVPDLILLDAMMPGMDGFAVCVALRESSQTRDIPVIFVTALDSPEDETRALETGAVDFITKPVNAAVVRARVRTHLALKRQSDLLRQMTLTDALTGVANRRCFDERLAAEWRRCERAGLPLAMIMVDIDHFKRYNDHYGHPAGDACLEAVARALARSVSRPSDLVARYGGEEFVMLLPQEDVDGAVSIARRMQDKVRALSIPHADSPVSSCVSISLGVAARIPHRDQTALSLLGEADAHLYRAKQSGRDRLCAMTG